MKVEPFIGGHKLALRTPDGAEKIFNAEYTPDRIYIKLENGRKFKKAKQISQLYDEFLYNISHTPEVLGSIRAEQTHADHIIVSVNSTLLLNAIKQNAAQEVHAQKAPAKKAKRKA